MPRKSNNKYIGSYKKRGRPPLNWTPPFNPILKVNTGLFIVVFD